MVHYRLGQIQMENDAERGSNLGFAIGAPAGFAGGLTAARRMGIRGPWGIGAAVAGGIATGIGAGRAMSHMLVEQGDPLSSKSAKDIHTYREGMGWGVAAGMTSAAVHAATSGMEKFATKEGQRSLVRGALGRTALGAALGIGMAAVASKIGQKESYKVLNPPIPHSLEGKIDSNTAMY